MFFYCNQTEDVSRVFLDISKSFEKLWPEGTLLKLETSGVKGKTLHLLTNYLSKHDQRLVSVDKFLHVSRSGVRKGSMPDPLMLLYFPVSKDFDKNISSLYINKNLKKISNRPFQGKMQIISKEQVQDITFLRRLVSKTHLALDILNLKWTCYAPKNHLGLLLGKRVIFNEHIPSKMIKYYKTLNVIKKSSSDLPRDPLLKI